MTGLDNSFSSYRVDFCPEPMLQSLLGLLELLVMLEGVEMGENAHDFREAVYLTDV